MKDKDVQNKIASMSPGQVRCRAYGHAWSPHTVETNRKRTWFRVTQQCHRFGNQRVQYMNSKGVAGNWSVRYITPGYLIKGLGRLKASQKGAFRLSALEGTSTTVVDD